MPGAAGRVRPPAIISSPVNSTQWAGVCAGGELIESEYRHGCEDRSQARLAARAVRAVRHPVQAQLSPSAVRPRIAVMLSREEVDHVGRLARLELSDADAARMASELSKILDHIEAIRALDLDGVEPTSHVVDVVNALRDDVPHRSLDQRQALAAAPEPTAAGFGVPSPGASA